MKRLLAAILILALLLPAAAVADGKLGMTMDEFIKKYNALPAPIGSPYLPISTPIKWTVFNNYNVAWFYPCRDTGTAIMLMSEDKETGQKTSAGLDKVQIYSGKDWVQLVSVANRCASLFSGNLLTVSMSPYYITDIVTYYYENNAKASDSISYRTINDDQTVILCFFNSSGDDYFQICLLEEMQ